MFRKGLEKHAGLLFLLLYLTAMVRPVSPILNYAINTNYYIEVLCENKSLPKLNCNGKCYLKKELKEANQSSSSEQSNSLLRIEMEHYPISLLEDPLLIPQALSALEFEQHSNYLFNLKEFDLPIGSPPPKITC